MDELRIVAKREGGGYSFQVYDASELFDQAGDLVNQNRCEEAVALYDKIEREFSSSPYVSASLYNAGLCLQKSGKAEQAAEHYSRLCESLPDSPDVKDASFQLLQILTRLGRWPEALNRAEALLARSDLSSDERLEALAQRAAALLGAGRWDEAETEARSALSYYRTRPADQAIADEYYAAQANYVLAETYRRRGQSLQFPAGEVEAQRQVLIRRAELLLEAQREYFNTIQLQNALWAAASGYHIGQMYDELWEAIMNAPVPEHLSPEAHGIYRNELAKLIEPLIRHAIRYWELTLMLIERTGTQSEWLEQTKKDLERVRQRLLEQPAGAGGLPPSAPPAAEPQPAASPPAQKPDAGQPPAAPPPPAPPPAGTTLDH